MHTGERMWVLLTHATLAALIAIPPPNARCGESATPDDAAELSRVAMTQRETPSDLSTAVLQNRLKNMITPNPYSRGPNFLTPDAARHIGAALSDAPVSIETGGLVSGLGRFAVVARRGGLTIDRLFLRVHGYAQCPLRDEATAMEAPTSVWSYSFWLSPYFRYFDLVPQSEPGQSGAWRYDVAGADEFGIRVSAEPYTLYLVSLVAVGRDDSRGSAAFAVESPILPVLFVQGNAGGCLELSRWFSKRLLMEPPERSLREQFGSVLAYQVATLDPTRSSAFFSRATKLPLNVVRETRVELIAALKRIHSITGGSFDPVVFDNAKRLQDAEKSMHAGIADLDAAQLLSWGTGVTGLIALLGLAVVLIFRREKRPVPGEAMLIVRIIIALAGAGFAAMLPGFLNVDGSVNGVAVRAGGALAAFLVLYFWNPPSMVGRRSSRHRRGQP